MARALRSAWNWLIVGEAYRKPGVSLERAAAANWLVRAFVLLLAICVGFFLKYSIEQGLLGPRARVTMSLFAGTALICWGLRLLGRRYQLLGQGLLATGLATLYFAIYAAAGLFALVSMPVGFLLMAFVTLTAGALAIRCRSLLLAVLGTLGGYLTPLMLAAPDVAKTWFHGYLLLLALGVGGIAWRRDWPALLWLSIACHYLLFFHDAGWTTSRCDFGATMPFFAAWFMVFTTAACLPGMVGRHDATLAELGVIFLLAAIFYGGGYPLVRASFSKSHAAWLPLAMAAYYTLHAALLLRRATRDRTRLTLFLALAAGALALTLPLLLSQAWLTMSWAVLALAMLAVAARLDNYWLRGLALLLYLMVAVRSAAHDLPLAYGGGALGAAGRHYLLMALDRLTQFGVITLAFAGAWRLLRRGAATAARGSAAALTVAYLLAFVTLSGEAYRLCGWLWRPLQTTAITLVWVSFACHLLLRRGRLAGHLLTYLLWLAIAALGIKMAHDIVSWQSGLPDDLLCAWYRQGFFPVRLLDVGGVLLWLFLVWRLGRREPGPTPPQPAALCGYAALALLFAHLTLETGTLAHRYLPAFHGGAVTICWGLYALALVYAGLHWQARSLRLIGLALFAVTVAKVFLSDLEHLATTHRIVAFGALGVIVMLAALAYLRPPRTGGHEDA